MVRYYLPTLMIFGWVVVGHGAEPADVAFTADLKISPDVVSGSEKLLIDGNVSTAATFEVGTTGEGTFTFSFIEPRPVQGVRFYQSSESYYSTAYIIEADTDGQGNFDTVLAEATEFPINQWVEHSWEPMAVHALRFRSVQGVSEGRRAHPVLAEFQILGMLQPDDVRVAGERGIAVPRLPQVREISRDTHLVIDGRQPAVLAPDEEAYQPAVEALMQGLAAAGVQAEKVSDIEAADPATRTVICLGSMLNNPLIERLYWNRYTFADALVPDVGQYLLHTVYDPYPYNGDNNIIIIGCSNSEGAMPGVRRLLEALDGQIMPYLVECGPIAPVSDEIAQRVASEQPDPTFLDLATNVNLYLKTGCDAYAQKAVRNMEIMADMYQPDGERYVPIGSSTMRKVPWPEETSSWAIQCAWDAFEYYPGITDQLRLDFTNAMLQYTRDLVSHVSGYSQIGTPNIQFYNHTTFPLIGVHFGARYFNRYYGLADMPEKLEKARVCLMTQSGMWRAFEDADAYLTYATEHSQIYSLAENEMHYFETGLINKYADYIVGTCDNQGLGSGFGDSSLSVWPPTFPPKVLPLALWWSRDGGYQWLMDHYMGTGWRNPYEQGVEPVRPDRFTGVNVFWIDPPIYDGIQAYPTYNEPFVKAEVPVEESFDKISFRENWEPDGQYMLLDGISRLYHLHYDGNSIITFVEGGEKWLLDHDYLTRNTTEHTMLSVLRDGRCEQLVPSLSGISAWADLPGFGYTDTYTRAYNGCDWHRQILWRRGGWFLVADTVTARDTGDYDLDLTWKTLDEEGNQRVVDGSNFLAERGITPPLTTDCTVIDDAEASGGKAVLMDRKSSQIVFGVDLPAGKYQLAIVGYGVDGSSDSLWVEVDSGAPQAFHMPQKSYSRSASDSALTTATPTVTLEGDELHRIAVSLRELPPMRVDRFIFQDAAGQSHVFEAHELPAPPEHSPTNVRSLHIKPATPVQAWVTNHVRAGISVPISILHQRHSSRLAAGDSVRLASLMYVNRPGKPRDLEPVQINSNLLAVQGSDPALVLLGEATIGELEATVRSGLMTTDSIMLSGLQELRMPGLTLAASTPIDLEMTLRDGKTMVRAPEGTAQLRLQIADDTRTFDLEGGEELIELTDVPTPTASITEFIAQTIASARDGHEETAAVLPEAKPIEPSWTALGQGDGVWRMRVADLRDGQGTRLFVCRGRSVYCLDANGNPLWSYDTNGIVRDVAFGDLRDTPGDEVIVGSADTYLYMLSSQGELLDRHQMRGTPWARSFGDNPYGVFGVLTGDITGDGRDDILVTMANFDLQALTADWELLWKYDHALHGSMQLSLEDTDGDGAADTIFVGNKYGSSVACDFAGTRRYQRYTSIGDVCYAVADLTGDGQMDVVTGSSTGDLIATRFADPSAFLWRLDNYGYAANRLRAADLNGDGAAEVILASGTGYVYVVDGSGQVLWQHRTGLCCNDVLVVEKAGVKTVVAADEAGEVVMIDAQGSELARLKTPSPPRLLTELSVGDDVKLAVALADGSVLACPLP